MTVRILDGDCRQVLAGLPDQSVHCCVTSPSYFGLRDYGTGTWSGGDPGCGHVVGEMRRGVNLAASAASTRGGGIKAAEVADIQARSSCPHCGAQRIDSQIGLEATPDAFVAELVAVFREVRRVLRDDGTLWLNLGDSYSTTPRGNRDGTPETSTLTNPERQDKLWGKHGYRDQQREPRLPRLEGVKQKDLLGIPWMVAFALRADGWYLRQDIVWSKPNPMPESVQDRCTKAHEYLFLLSKAPTYHCDMAAIAEPCESGESDLRKMREGLDRIGGKHKDLIDPLSKASSATNIGRKRSVGSGETRNRRSVWTVASQPFKSAHFATFPPALIEPCILAGCPPGGVVLDPFGGAGTTGLVADRHQRDALLIELNPEYAAMARRRISDESPLFAEVAA